MRLITRKEKHGSHHESRLDFAKLDAHSAIRAPQLRSQSERAFLAVWEIHPVMGLMQNEPLRVGGAWTPAPYSAAEASLLQDAVENFGPQRTYPRDIGKMLVKCDQLEILIEANLCDKQVHRRRD